MAGKIWWTVAISAIIAFVIIIIIVAIGTFSTYKIVKSSTGEMTNILKNTTEELSKVSNQLSSLNELNSHLTSIQTNLGTANKKIDEISKKSTKTEEIKPSLENISKEIASLEKKYPPSQNFFIQDISNENLSKALNVVFEPQIENINNKIKNLSFNFYWSLFNSLFSVSLVGVSIYLIFRTKKSKS